MVQTVAVYLFALKLCVQSSLDVLRSELSFQIHVRITEITGTYLVVVLSSKWIQIAGEISSWIYW